jgi:hypothetical protein
MAHLLQAFVDRYWFRVACVLAPMVLLLNYYAGGMEGLLDNYLEFKRIILSGFHGSLTFPMWGYGWFMILSENRLVLLLLQNVLALVALAVFERHLARTGLLRGSALTMFRAVMAVSVPWFAFNSLRWPNSIAASLLALAAVFFHRGLSADRGGWRDVLASGMLFGLALNFRSDFCAFTLPFAAGCFCLMRTGRAAARLALWILAVAGTLIPWMAYTRHATGQVLLTSSNAGHVFYIGLGNLPGNTWGITDSDGDPSMHRVVRDHFGRDLPTFVPSTDTVLKREFLRLVKENPGEYARKCAYVFSRVLVSGTYFGEFIQTADRERSARFEAELTRYGGVARVPLAVYREYGLQQGLRLACQVASFLFSRILLLLACLAWPVAFAAAWRERSPFFLFVTAAMAYNVMLSVLSYYMPSYLSATYLFQVAVLAKAATQLSASSR